MAILAFGGFAEQAVAKQEETFPIPDSMPFEAAGAFPIAYISSHLAIRWQGRLEAGETLLVLGAAGTCDCRRQYSGETGRRSGTRCLYCHHHHRQSTSSQLYAAGDVSRIRGK